MKAKSKRSSALERSLAFLGDVMGLTILFFFIFVVGLLDVTASIVLVSVVIIIAAILVYNKKIVQLQRILITAVCAFVIALAMFMFFTIFLLPKPAWPMTTCIASAGFECLHLALSHTTGNITATVGQATGTSWGPTLFIFSPLVATRLTVNIPVSGSAAAAVAFTKYGTVNSTFTSGQVAQITLGAIAPSSAVGTQITGSIWACYESLNSGTAGILTYVSATGECVNAGTAPVNYVQVASLTVPAS
jgi:hypothetical protein